MIKGQHNAGPTIVDVRLIDDSMRSHLDPPASKLTTPSLAALHANVKYVLAIRDRCPADLNRVYHSLFPAMIPRK